MGAPNVLILDAPTNALDIATLQVLEGFLDNFPGIVIVVSHDRYFLDRIADRIAAFEDGRIKVYEGGYTDYLEKRAGREETGENSGGEEKKGNSSGGSSRKKRSYRDPEREKLRFTFAEQKEFETIDEDIEALENKMETIEEEISKNATNFVKLNEWVQEKENVQKQLDEKMERWVYLNDLAERIEEQRKERQS